MPLSRTVKVAWKRIDQAIYKNAHRRFGKSVLRLTVFGGDLDGGVRVHEHMLVARPPHVPADMLRSRIADGWKYAVDTFLSRRIATPPYDRLVGNAWLEARVGDVGNIAEYTMRYEGATFGAGQSKVDIENCYLNPIDS